MNIPPLLVRTVFFSVALLVTLGASVSSADTEWTQFAGSSGNFTSDTSGLASRWPESGPPVLWEREIGSGYSALVGDGQLVVAFHRDGDEDVVSAHTPATGEPLWSHRYKAPGREGNLEQFGFGPHASPLLLPDRVVTLGYGGSLRALGRASGKLLWSHELIDTYGGNVMRWGHTASPVLVDGKVVVLVGGKQAGAMAFDPTTGKESWRSAPTTVSHATPLVIDVDGQSQLLYYADDALYAIAPSNGESLWSFPVTNGYKNHSNMPIWDDDGLLWVSTQQEGATRALKLTRTDDATKVEQVWFNNKIRVHFWNAMRIGDMVYATTGDQVQNLAAIDAASGKIIWRKRGFSQANLLHTPVGTLLLDEDGELALLELSRDGMEIRSRAQVLDSTTWTPPALVGTTLYVRDKETLKALDLAAPAAAPGN